MAGVPRCSESHDSPFRPLDSLHLCLQFSPDPYFLMCSFPEMPVSPFFFLTYQRRKISVFIHISRIKTSLFSAQAISLPHYKHLLCTLQGGCASVLLSPFITQAFQLFCILFSLEHCLSHVLTRDIHHQGQRVNIVIYYA